ncbi:HPF/RaiA family ribosome-associated protein [Acidicapsa dinghuensis]|uniref:HPF/RaiA family ribosome-associated protein n=1 Tax=Acidicapsa dinghuensis TaxID=2218256 RepID=A0ABW1EP65_9BACT|nr:HPF/RaiA family ribosome-associated protein [Acidicapsa dinghuensis]
MEVEITARQVKVSKGLKAGAEEGIGRIGLILGKITSAAFTFRAERHLQIVEISLQSRNHNIVAHGEGATQESALRQALVHAEQQAQKFRDRTRTRKRLPKLATAIPEPRVPRKAVRVRRSVGLEHGTEPSPEDHFSHGNGHRAPIARPPGKKTKAAITVHSFPGKPMVVEPHILSAAEALAIRPMTVEEAVKEAEFQDRDLLIFRTPAGDLYVLHRRRDGKMEMVEVP